MSKMKYELKTGNGMKMKVSEIKGNFIKSRFIGLAIVILVLGGVGCQREAETPEYKNVERELALDGLENAFRKSGFTLAKTGRKGITEKGDAVRAALNPALAQSKKLLRTYGVSEEFLNNEFKDPNDPRIILAGLCFLATERQDGQARSINRAHLFDLGLFANHSFLFGAQKDWMECLLTAVGVDAIVEFLKGNITETLAKKAIRKIASRTLGWIGAALAVYEYGSCMDWY